MVRVGIRELRNKLSRYLRLVSQGETVVVMDRNKVVAEIRKKDGENDGDLVGRYLEEGALAGKILEAEHRRSRIRTLLAGSPAQKPAPDWQTAYGETRADR